MSASLPSSIPALVTIAQGALPTNFQVALSKVPPVYVPSQSLLITGVRFSKDAYAELGPTYRHEEQYTVSCSLFSSAGGSDALARLQEVYSLYTAIQEAIANNPTLNATVRLAWPKQQAFTPGADANGLDVGQLDFQVYCEVRVTSLN